MKKNLRIVRIQLDETNSNILQNRANVVQAVLEGLDCHRFWLNFSTPNGFHPTFPQRWSADVLKPPGNMKLAISSVWPETPAPGSQTASQGTSANNPLRPSKRCMGTCSKVRWNTKLRLWCVQRLDAVCLGKVFGKRCRHQICECLVRCRLQMLHSSHMQTQWWSSQ